MEFYWKLEYGDYRDPKSVMIPPGKVQVVQKRWDNGDPIHLNTGSIPANQIRSFEITNRPVTEQPLIEGAAQAFKEPILTKNGIACKWVKKDVTQDQWNRYFSSIPGYKRLFDDSTMVTVAFIKAIHDIDVNKTPYCTPEEVKYLTKS